MNIIVQEKYIIPQSPEGKKYADDLGGYLLIKGLFKERTEDNVHIYVTAESALDVAERKEE